MGTRVRGAWTKRGDSKLCDKAVLIEICTVEGEQLRQEEEETIKAQVVAQKHRDYGLARNAARWIISWYMILNGTDLDPVCDQSYI